MNGFCDLNVIESLSYTENLLNVKQLITLGYSVVAINRIQNVFDGLKKKINNEEKRKRKETVNDDIFSIKNLIQRLTDDINKLQDPEFNLPKDFKLLSRLTFPLENFDQIPMLRNDFYKELFDAFDIISVIPGNEKMFKALVDGKIDVDIISLPLENKLEYKPTHNLVSLATSRDLTFEICYSAAIKSVSLRKSIFSNGKQLVQKTKHARGIVLCSGGSTRMDFRSPHDVANIANLFDLKGAHCLNSVRKNAHIAISHAFSRKYTFKGILMVEEMPKDSSKEPLSKKLKFSSG
ncbi:ribonuclease P protein subunit p30 [Hydra vulgaris]|nr:ribonuclease P protein subunit p30 [Hydra vulgaris]